MTSAARPTLPSLHTLNLLNLTSPCMSMDNIPKPGAPSELLFDQAIPRLHVPQARSAAEMRMSGYQGLPPMSPTYDCRSGIPRPPTPVIAIAPLSAQARAGAAALGPNPQNHPRMRFRLEPSTYEDAQAFVITEPNPSAPRGMGATLLVGSAMTPYRNPAAWRSGRVHPYKIVPSRRKD